MGARSRELGASTCMHNCCLPDPPWPSSLGPPTPDSRLTHLPSPRADHLTALGLRRPSPPQFPAVPHRAVYLALRHLDAGDCPGLVGVAADRLGIRGRSGHGTGITSDSALR